jgi:alkanesulfonate monooxygenase SsuD/methylene tetrahydromethanopterin reductase-like flavin-dependent oxidoreductase (luciferase family)
LVGTAILYHLEGETEESWPSGRAYGEVLDQVAAAEAMGYDAVWFAEHHVGAMRGRLPNPLLLITRAADRTRRIRLGPAVLLTPYYHPLRLAEDVAMADLLTDGRLNVGLSSGGGVAEASAFGEVLTAEKHTRLAAVIEFLRAAWRGEEVQPEGASAPVTVTPLPGQRFEEMVWVAASSHGAAEVAGACGAHLLLPSLKSVEQSAAHVATYRRALVASGHDPAGRQIQVTMHAWIDTDRGRALAEGLPIARTYAERYIASRVVPAVADEPFAETLERINFVVGDADDLRAAVALRRAALGITQIALQLRLGGMSHERTLRMMEECGRALIERAE